MADVLLGEQYRVLINEKLGTGSSAFIYKGIDIETKQPVAVKTSRYRGLQDNLEEETKIYKHLEGVRGIPKLCWHGYREERYFVVMELLGEDLNDKYKRDCSIRDACIIVQQVLQTLEDIHKRGYLHMDLKPHNIMVGTKNPNEVYIIDFGVGIKVFDDNSLHVEPSEDFQNDGFTPFYASANILKKLRPSRRDDLIIFGYVLLDMFSLIPWTGDEDTDTLINMRQNLTGQMRDSVFSTLPRQFYEYLVYCEKLEFAQDPDYSYLSWLFKDVFREKGFQNPGVLAHNDPESWDDIFSTSFLIQLFGTTENKLGLKESKKEEEKNDEDIFRYHNQEEEENFVSENMDEEKKVEEENEDNYIKAGEEHYTFEGDDSIVIGDDDHFAIPDDDSLIIGNNDHFILDDDGFDEVFHDDYGFDDKDSDNGHNKHINGDGNNDDDVIANDLNVNDSYQYPDDVYYDTDNDDDDDHDDGIDVENGAVDKTAWNLLEEVEKWEEWEL